MIPVAMRTAAMVLLRFPAPDPSLFAGRKDGEYAALGARNRLPALWRPRSETHHFRQLVEIREVLEIVKARRQIHSVNFKVFEAP